VDANLLTETENIGNL